MECSYALKVALAVGPPCCILCPATMQVLGDEVAESSAAIGLLEISISALLSLKYLPSTKTLHRLRTSLCGGDFPDFRNSRLYGRLLT